MKRKIFWGMLLLMVSVILVLFSFCTKKSTRYEPAKGYYLYASDIGDPPEQRKIYVFSTLTDSLVDSISLGSDLYATALGLSPDRRTLYARCERILSDTSREYLGCEIDTRTKRLKYIGPNSFPIISPDGKYLFGKTKSGFAIFDAYTHQVVYQDTVSFLPFCFNKKDHLAYGIRLEGKEMDKIMVFDYELMRWVRSFTIRLWGGGIPGIGPLVISTDGNTLYLLVRAPNYLDYFCVYDLTRDSVLVQIGINYIGYLAIKPDGSTVYITDPGGGGGCIAWEPEPTGVVGVFDTRTNTPLPSISLDPLADSLISPPIAAYHIRITPDGKKAYLSSCGRTILVIDLVRNEALKAIIGPKRDLMFYFIAL